MSARGDLINFDVIETQKENIQSIPSGRSAKTLAATFSPLADKSASPSLDDTRTLNDAVQKEYEVELQSVDESDDPLDIYDRYVKWTLDAYPSSQATPQSGLLPLLERATKSFLSSPQYKNDPRYLRLWLHYIRLFSDAPRETFAFLARHGIGDVLALFYEEFAAWLESAGRFSQAEEVYQLGLEKEARPTERLLRKFGEFKDRLEQRPRSSDGPSSPALPLVRPALAAKVDPFASARTTDPQAADTSSRGASGPSGTRKGKPKMAIFSDSAAGTTDSAPVGGSQTKGWESIGSLQERSKENTVEPKPWVGETLKTGKKAGAVEKMTIFRDKSSPSLSRESRSMQSRHEHNEKERVDPRTGKVERVFANLTSIYPDPKNPKHEMSIEELRATKRGWMGKEWVAQRRNALKEKSKNIPCGSPPVHPTNSKENQVNKSLSEQLNEKLVVDEYNEASEDKDAATEGRDQKHGKAKKMKMREIKGETQTVKTNLDSPTGGKLKKRNSMAAEPTMTFHTRAATDEIYSIFNQPLKSEVNADENAESLCGSDIEDDDYTSAGESTATGRISTNTSEFGDDGDAERVGNEVTDRNFGDETKGDITGVSEWTEFTDQHIPGLNPSRTDEPDESPSKASRTQSTEHPSQVNKEENNPSVEQTENAGRSRFVPVPPEDYNPPVGPYRDAEVVAQNRLPFMTPIVEQTESSLASSTMFREKGYQYYKTPSKMARSFASSATPAIPEMDDDVDLLLSSPFRDYTQLNEGFRFPLGDGSPSRSAKKLKSSPLKGLSSASSAPRVIIDEQQCNPMDAVLRGKILENISPPIQAYPGYVNHQAQDGGYASNIKKFLKSLARGTKNNEKALNSPIISLDGASRDYEVKRELGEGGFAPVYLAESIDSPDTFSSDSEQDANSNAMRGLGRQPQRDFDRKSLEAVKVESDPPSAWEFYMLRTAHNRLNSSVYRRCADSIIQAHELHLFNDESILVEDYLNQGTLVELLNATDSGLEEVVVMFFAAELFRTVEALHACGIIHGDLKEDNCLVRLQGFGQHSNSSMGDHVNMDEEMDHYSATGAYGWRNNGLTLIDFGRGIDMQAFSPSAQFIADWKVGAHECSEMRECRPWTYQVDLYGLAGIIYTMLFGKAMEVVPAQDTDGGDAGSPGLRASGGVGSRKVYRIKDTLKRYWERDIWAEVFDLCLNPSHPKWSEIEQQQHNSAQSSPVSAPLSRSDSDSDLASAKGSSHLPVVQSMGRLREKMEEWLAANAGRKGLQSQLTKLETLLAKKRTKRGSEKF